MRPIALFDLDNTLVDRQAAYRRWCEWFTASRGLGPDACELLHQLDEDGFAPRERVFAGLRAAFDVAEPVPELIATYRATYVGFFAPDPEVDKALGVLRAHDWAIGVVTNGPPSQRDKLRRSGIDRLVDDSWISDEVGVAKPDRRIFDRAVAALRRRGPGNRAGAAIGAAAIRPGPVWMVGDSPWHDILGGWDAGLRTIWLHRRRAWPAADFRPDVEASSIAEAVAVMIDG